MASSIPPAALTSGRIFYGHVKNLPPDSVLVEADGDEHLCQKLNDPDLAIGDPVLAWSAPDGRISVVLGRIGPRSTKQDPAAKGAPEELVLSATRKLVLRCGEGEIILRGDGKVLIRGTDLVSKAKATNRIKGGQVVIN